MTKRLCSLLLTVTVIFTVISGVFAQFNDVEKNTQAIDVVTGLGLMSGYDDGTFLPDNNITRSEFATMLAAILDSGDDEVQEWKNEFFKDMYEETGFIEDFESTSDSYIEEELFIDVDDSNDAYNAIRLMKSMGLMEGVSLSEFDPEGNITVQQAIKVIVAMLGYKVFAEKQGGFPNGYISQGVSLGITDNIESLSGNLTRGDMAVMLYNALEVEVMQVAFVNSVNGVTASYQTVEGETFLYKVLGIVKLEGRMTDNGYTSLSGPSVNASEQYITIDGYTVQLNDNQNSIREYIGRHVYAYCDYNEEDDECLLRYMMLSGRDEVTTFDVEDFDSYDETSISYYNDRDRLVKVSINKSAYLIYNGSAVDSYTEDIFDFNVGDVSIIRAKGENRADLIIVNSYTNIFVDYIDKTEKIIYQTVVDGSTGEYNNLFVDLDDEDDDKYIFIYDSEGSEIDFENISLGSVLTVAQGSNVIKVMVSVATVQDYIVTSYNAEDGILSSGDVRYTVSRNLLNTDEASDIKAGNKYILYLDVFGEVAKVVSVTSNTGAGVMISAIYADDEGEGDLKIKYCSVDGVVTSVYPADKVYLIDCEGEKKKYERGRNFNVLSEILEDYIDNKGYKGFFTYILNDEKLISTIELPGEQLAYGNEDNRLVAIRMINDGRDYREKTDTSAIGSYGYYYKEGCGFAGKMMVESTTPVFLINTSLAEEGSDDAYSVDTTSVFSNEHYYEVKGFTTVADSIVAQYLIFERASSAKMSVSNSKYAIVKSIKSGIDVDDNPIDIIECYVTDEGDKELSVNEGVLDEIEIIQDNPMTNDAGEPVDANGDPLHLTLEQGDAFRYQLDAYGNVERIQLVFDENAINPASGGQGNLASSFGCWLYDSVTNSDSKYYMFANPFALHETSLTFTSAARDVGSAGNIRFSYYHPVSVDGNIVKLTTQDLNCQSYDDTNSKYITDNYVIGNIIFVEFLGGGKIDIYTGTADQLKTYAISGSSCDRVFVQSRMGSVSRVIAYRGFSK